MHKQRIESASIGRGGRRLSTLLTLLALALLPAIAARAETRAGTLVTNIANLQVRGAEGAWTVASNPAALVVAERLDVALVRADDARIDIVQGGIAAPLVLTNRGNGGEAFDVTAALSDPSARVRLIAIDRDGDGRFDAAADLVLTDGRTPMLDPGESVKLLVVLDPAGIDVTAAALSVTTRAVTGSGPPGTLFAQRGDGGADAVTGPTTARADLVVPLGAAATAVPVLTKSQVVRAADGTARPVAGAVVTYRLEARFAGPTAGARIDDPIPQGTAYVPGSLMLDAAPLSDAADGDAGSADENAVAVALGDVPAAGIRVVQFQVTIQ